MGVCEILSEICVAGDGIWLFSGLSNDSIHSMHLPVPPHLKAFCGSI